MRLNAFVLVKLVLATNEKMEVKENG